jgi:glycosyltransferase involved in cell wall biosynthesis
MITISVIIPTHNRSVSLRRTLGSLQTQSFPADQIEVLVICDGCTDETVQMLSSYRAPFSLHVFEQPRLGAAAARNYGASRARGLVFLFLDDDIEAASSLIEAHVRAHQNESGQQVVIGPYPPFLQRRGDFFRAQTQTWWENKFESLRQPGHRYTYKDLLSGNLSVRAELFAAVGGFDSAFKDCGGEDYEFGLRLIKNNVTFTFASDALAYHHEHETTDLQRSFRRARQEGCSDILIARRHPEMRTAIPFAHFASPYSFKRHVLHLLGFTWPTLGLFLAESCCRALHLLERLRLYRHWRKVYNTVRSYWYWRGVADELTWRTLTNLAHREETGADSGASMMELDLAKGLEPVEKLIDLKRPSAAIVRYGAQYIGVIPAELGAERLRGIHLRPILANTLGPKLLQAMAQEGAIIASAKVDRLKLSNSIKRVSQWFGPIKPGQMWWEQYSQWKVLERERLKTRRGRCPHVGDHMALSSGSAVTSPKGVSPQVRSE